ncbi:MAG: SDR family oxidoreductase [Bacteroidales bacterium]
MNDSNYLLSNEFNDKVAIVTGGTSGLGRHLVETLVSLGSDVFFCGRDKEKGEIFAKSIGDKGHFIQCDLQNVDEILSFVKKTGTFKNRIDYLVNNAAIDPRIKFEEATVNDFDRLIAINLRSYFVVAQSALPYIKDGEGKAIVNISTCNFMAGCSPFTIYNASKSGIIGFTRSLARELGPLNIRVNTLSPGWIMTERQLNEYVTEKDKKELLEAQCLKFFLTEKHVTPVTLFLLSNLSLAITGQNLVVDSGKIMQ